MIHKGSTFAYLGLFCLFIVYLGFFCLFLPESGQTAFFRIFGTARKSKSANPTAAIATAASR
jgi:hypothetical protein